VDVYLEGLSTEDRAMGMLGNLFNRNAAANPNLPAAYSTPPAGGSLKDRFYAGSNAVIDRATQIYQRNPKLVGGLALLAGAAVLAGVRKRGRI